MGLWFEWLSRCLTCRVLAARARQLAATAARCARQISPALHVHQAGLAQQAFHSARLIMAVLEQQPATGRQPL